MRAVAGPPTYMGARAGGAMSGPPTQLGAHQQREHGLALRRLAEATAKLGPLEDLDVRPHAHPVVLGAAPRGAAVVLGERVLDVGLADEDVAQVRHREARVHLGIAEVAEVALAPEHR